KIRKYVNNKLPQAAISKVVIERPAKICRISIYAARPGVIIGKKGADIEKLKRELQKMTSSEVSLNIVEIRKPEIDAKLVAQGIADQLERRIAFRRAMKREGFRPCCNPSAPSSARPLRAASTARPRAGPSSTSAPSASRPWSRSGLPRVRSKPPAARSRVT